MHKKPFSVVISASNDGSFALSHIERICKGYRLKMVQKPIVCKGRPQSFGAHLNVPTFT